MKRVEPRVRSVPQMERIRQEIGRQLDEGVALPAPKDVDPVDEEIQELFATEDPHLTLEQQRQAVDLDPQTARRIVIEPVDLRGILGSPQESAVGVVRARKSHLVRPITESQARTLTVVTLCGAWAPAEDTVRAADLSEPWCPKCRKASPWRGQQT